MAKNTDKKNPAENVAGQAEKIAEVSAIDALLSRLQEFEGRIQTQARTIERQTGAIRILALELRRVRNETGHPASVELEMLIADGRTGS